jgi:molybdate-binding protein
MLATSATVGSLAGIQAVREGRAHVAGVHLLDVANGEYNRPQVASAFPHQRAFLVTLAGESTRCFRFCGHRAAPSSIREPRERNGRAGSR